MIGAHPRGWKGRVSYGRGQTIHVIAEGTEITAKHRTISRTPKKEREGEGGRKRERGREGGRRQIILNNSIHVYNILVTQVAVKCRAIIL